MTLAAGAALGPYEVIELLGAGGMGEVYRARDPRLGRDVAVKVLPEEVAGDAQRLGFFEREARAVAALNHPNILTVHDVGRHEGTPYVVTELLEGENLRELVSRRTPTAHQILAYALQAARGLEAAHAKDIVHRDLKPENLFRTTDGRVKVLDFGLAKLVRREDVQTDAPTPSRSAVPGQVAGTVAYMSPEQARGQPLGAGSDVFSFGVVLHELLAGKHPFKRDTAAATLTAIVDETPAGLGSLSRGIPPAVGGIVRRCLEKGKEDRYASGHDLAVALETVLAAPAGAAVLLEVEERSPYPGLSSFTEKDAGVFFGREREVEELWGRIQNWKLLAVIGPSGVGKTSFVRAGVVARRPEGWAAIVCTPGTQPLVGLGQALAPELAGDREALQELPRFDDPAVAFDLISRWRKVHGEALLVVDQFEELFTLNSPEAPERFASLLGRLAKEADVHVLLSVRDDFLIRCHEQSALTSVFEHLTPLLVLRRSGSWDYANADIDPEGDLLVASTQENARLTFWPLRKAYPTVADAGPNAYGLTFSEDSQWLATSGADGTVRLLPLPGTGSQSVRTLSLPEVYPSNLVFAPRDEFLLTVGLAGRAYVVPLDGSPGRKIEGFPEDRNLLAAAVSPSGRRVATASSWGQGERKLGAWDLETGERWLFDLPETPSAVGFEGIVTSVHFMDETTLLADGDAVRRWDLETGSHELVWAAGTEEHAYMSVASDGRRAAIRRSPKRRQPCDGVFEVLDLTSGTVEPLPSFGDCFTIGQVLNTCGPLAVTGDAEGVVRVGRLSGEEPHLLIGHEGAVNSVAISPDLRWVASTGTDKTVRLWPMPDLDEPPLHTLPHGELFAKLRSLTNLRAVRDPETPNGWTIELDDFPGWKEGPEW